MTDPDATNHLMLRSRAVQEIAHHITRHDAYLITVPPGMLTSAARALDAVTTWQAYIDNGSGVVLRTGLIRAVRPNDRATAAVIAVPKTVDPAVLGKALRYPLPADGSRDLLVLRGRTGPIHWPLLFVDAIDQVDPVAAAQLRAHSLPTPA
ncbi:hypothetical protein [Kitasatospora sp. NPDC007106]|uniref:hypothetical protein n=1 Tax=Kitasatospora sp. NPDC007106 TaxID=3156914 RepID=UPI0033CEEDFB